MNIINYPLPLDNWELFRPDVEKFTRTFREFDPGEGYELRAMCCWNDPTDVVKEMFRGIKCQFIRYDGPGQDSGSAQFSADQMAANNFMICLTTRHYFWKAGWLKKMCDARRQFGPGLYGVCANRETYPLHLCLRFYGIDSDDFKQYPFHLNSKLRCHQWEVHYALSWMRGLGHVTKLVLWDGVYDEPKWFSRPNRFRNGDQSNLLVFDRHSDSYRDGSPQHRAELEAYQRA